MTPTLLITGANRGIGLALTELYLEHGWQVIACCRFPGSAPHLMTLKNRYSTLTTYGLDVTDHTAIQQLALQLIDTPIHLLINNAGLYGPKGYQFGDVDTAAWREVLEVNTIAPLVIAEHFTPHLEKASQSGHTPIFAFLSSKVGSMSDNQSGGGYIYRSSKAALNAVIKSLSIDLRSKGIRSIALHPGWVQTQMGGPNALINTATSAQGLKYVLDTLTDSQNGNFIDYQGQEIGW
ncbi:MULTISPECIES: SDR family oxidoreductase [unclassified Salinivibrio]|uniref:SDR family oxidoreductase n=1 Tax=unclassified Salinivibrio TaxID=2636825 RepID=UPI00128B8BC1|nr:MULTISPECIES: SDR family oxidoreductase [unclassified Salinivibrio]MPS30911.1 SDR family oxidoreductase [Salinivibrio sp. VYel7]MPX89548.1 SDR family oxidoreductase [Salinivibrio sp. VYel1]MPX92312.1 SDR family oxidoreductase [Salinivibrio sp. VYel9]MPX97112.1 SDR family oxidoreductase [Salinivibrio sp. VYel6]MPX98544.1 SDR family oxidoreductase [Salinivibrio sp. VYel4]